MHGELKLKSAAYLRTYIADTRIHYVLLYSCFAILKLLSAVHVLQSLGVQASFKRERTGTHGLDLIFSTTNIQMPYSPDQQQFPPFASKERMQQASVELEDLFAAERSRLSNNSVPRTFVLVAGGNPAKRGSSVTLPARRHEATKFADLH